MATSQDHERGFDVPPAPLLTEAVLNILLALARGERHGYAIMQETEERTEGRVVLGAGTLYGALKRLRERGLIEEVQRTPASTRGAAPAQRRRLYRLTDSSAQVLVDELRRYCKTIRLARSLGVPPG